jgi:hypothetical protein
MARAITGMDSSYCQGMEPVRQYRAEPGPRTGVTADKTCFVPRGCHARQSFTGADPPCRCIPDNARDGTDLSDVTSAAKSAAETLTSAAQDKLPVKDILGADVSRPGGKTIETVENFVVIPGGRVVAAIMATDAKGTGRIPVPLSMVKVPHTAGKLGLTLPVGLSKLKNMKEIQTLAAMPGMK